MGRATSRRRILRLIAGAVLAPVLGLKLSGVSAAQETVLSLTQSNATLSMRGDEVVSIGGIQAYDGANHGFRFYKNGVLVMAPAAAVSVAPGDTVSWVAMDVANSQVVATVATVQVPQLPPPPAPVPVVPSPSVPVSTPPRQPKPVEEARPEPEVRVRSVTNQILKGFTLLVWRGPDGSLVQEELRANSLSSLVAAVYRFKMGTVAAYRPGLKDKDQGFLTLNDGDTILVHAVGSGTWTLRVREGKKP